MQNRIKGYVPKKIPPKTPEELLSENLKKSSRLISDLETFKIDTTAVLDLKVQETEAILGNALTLIEQTKDEAIQAVRDIKQGEKGDKGDPGEPAIPLDQDEVVQEVLSRIEFPEPQIIDTEELKREILSEIPEIVPIDEAKLLSRFLKNIPNKKGSLKIIQERVEIDPMSVIDEILKLGQEGKFKLPSSNIDGLEQTISAFHNQIGRRGYLHGGGISDITGLIQPGTGVTITGLGTKASPYVINSTGGGSITLQTNGTDNSSQILLNLTGSGKTTVTNTGGGNVVIATADSITIGTTAISGGAAGTVLIETGGHKVGELSYDTASTANTLVERDSSKNIYINSLIASGEIDFLSTGELKGAYTTYILGSTSHSGTGKNNITLTGPYVGTSTPTFTYTITSLDEQVLNVDDTSPFSVGDGVTGDTSGVGTVLYISSQGYIVVHATTSFAGDSTVTDTSSFGSANILSLTISDVGTFTDSTTTLSSMPIFEADSISGVSPRVPFASNRYRLHTVGNSWSATVAMTTGSGHIFYGDLATDEFVMGDKDNTGLGNIFYTDNNGGHSRWQIKDKLATYFNMEQGVNPTWSQLAGSGAGRFVGLDNNGTMSNVASPLSIGAAIGSAIADGVLFADASGNLKNNSSFVYHDQSGASTFKLAFPASASGNWIDINDNSSIIQVGTNTSGYINANGGFFSLNGLQVNISSLTGNQVLSCAPDNGNLQVGDIPQIGFGGIMNLNGQSGDIYFGTITGTRYVDFDMSNGIFTIGNSGGNNFIQVNQALETTAIYGGILVSQQYATPTTGSSITILDNMTSLRLNPAGTLTALTIVPPTAYDGRKFNVSTSQILTALTWTGSFKGAPTTSGANGFFRFEYSTNEAAWVRTG